MRGARPYAVHRSLWVETLVSLYTPYAVEFHSSRSNVAIEIGGGVVVLLYMYILSGRNYERVELATLLKFTFNAYSSLVEGSLVGTSLEEMLLFLYLHRGQQPTPDEIWPSLYLHLSCPRSISCGSLAINSSCRLLQFAAWRLHRKKLSVDGPCNKMKTQIPEISSRSCTHA